MRLALVGITVIVSVIIFLDIEQNSRPIYGQFYDTESKDVEIYDTMPKPDIDWDDTRLPDFDTGDTQLLPLTSHNSGTSDNPASTTKQSLSWKTYENSVFGVKINYPSDWTFENQDADIDRATYKPDDIDGLSNIVDFTSPPNSDTNATVSLDFYNIPSGRTLAEFVEGEIQDHASPTLFGKSYPGWTVVENIATTFANQSGQKVTYDHEDSNARWFFVYGIINDKAYSLEYQEDYPTPYDLYIGDVEKMADSFQVTGISDLDKPIQWAEFNDDSLGISLEHPVGWEIDRKENRFDEGPQVTISDNSESNLGEIKIIKPISSGSLIDAELATNSVLSGIIDEEGTRVIEEVNMNMYKVAGKEAGTFLVTYPNPLSTLLSQSSDSSSLPSSSTSMFNFDDVAQQMLVTVHKGKTYAIAFEADTDEFDIYEDTIDHIFRSVKFTN